MCGIAGVCNAHKNNAAALVRHMLHAEQNRGRDGCGITVHKTKGSKCRFYEQKFEGTVAQNFDGPVIGKMSGQDAVGHTRYATAANSNGPENTQPFSFSVDGMRVSIAHNGQFTNIEELENGTLKGTPFNTSSDSERFFRLILREHRSEPSWSKSIATALGQMKGSCSAILSIPRQMFAIRDSSGNRPLYWGRKGKTYVVASETCALDAIDVFDWNEVPPGTVMSFSKERGVDIEELPRIHLRACTFEEVYFKFPTSLISGDKMLTARQFRFELGRKIATASPVDADLIIGIPDSALEMANGFAAQTRENQSNNGAIMRRHDTGRSFTLPNQKQRNKAVNEKFAFDTLEVRGSVVVCIDDSCVRGTTSRRITKALKKRGAKEVHWRIPSPMILSPCYYGISIARYSELLAENKTLEEMRAEIAADSLEFLSLDDFKSVNKQCGMNPNHGCYSCMDGQHWNN